MIYLTVHFYIQPDKIAEAEALFRQHVADGARDRGNRLFTMTRDPEDETVFISLEAWETKADIENHDAQPHHPVFLRKLKGIQAREKEVKLLELFVAGHEV